MVVGVVVVALQVMLGVVVMLRHARTGDGRRGGETRRHGEHAHETDQAMSGHGTPPGVVVGCAGGYAPNAEEF
jgi:hypothetical protein